MTVAAETLLEQALTLPVQDRALLASGLLASLDSEALDEAEVDRLWSAETERRAAQLDSGDAKFVTWEHVFQRINVLSVHASGEKPEIPVLALS